MDHNVDLKDDHDVPQYLKRDLFKHKTTPPYKIVRDEVFGR